MPPGARLRVTTELTPLSDGTRLCDSPGHAFRDTALRNLFVRAFYRLRSRRIESLCRSNLATLKARVPSYRSTAATPAAITRS